MNNQQKQQAQHLYFQTDLSKTQIAELLNVSRRSLHYWIRENNWDRLKKSAAHLPSLLAENCYHIIAHFTEHLLSENRIVKPVTHQEADTLHKLTLTVKKLKNQATLNESMEMFAFFMEGVRAKAPQLAEALVPHVNDYMSSRAGIHKEQFMPASFNDLGYIPVNTADAGEEKLDLQDIMEWTEGDKPVVDIEQFRTMDKPSAAASDQCAPLNEETSAPSGAKSSGDEKEQNTPVIHSSVRGDAPLTQEEYLRYSALRNVTENPLIETSFAAPPQVPRAA